MREAEEAAALADAWPDVDIHTLTRPELPPLICRATAASDVMVAGSLAAIHTPAIGIVGTRRLSVDQVERLRPLIRSLIDAAGATVVSGGAYGVDAIAHEEALAVGVPTCVILASGLLRAGPAGNRATFLHAAREGGAVVSDKPAGHRPHRGDFLARNAIIASMADVLVVAAAPIDSGAMRTARDARRFGCTTLAVPGAHDDPAFAGCHELLRRGARLCTGPPDILAALGRPELPVIASTEPPAGPRQALDVSCRIPETTREKLLAELVTGASLDEAARVAECDAARAQSLLLELELEGRFA